MKTSVKKRVVISLGFIIILPIAAYLALPFLIRPEALRDVIIQSVEREAKIRLLIERSELSVLPLPTFRFSGIRVEPIDVSGGSVSFEVDELRCRLNILPLFFKQIDLSFVSIKRGKSVFTAKTSSEDSLPPLRLVFQDLNIDLRHVKSHDWMKAVIRGVFSEEKIPFYAEGKFRADFTSPDFNSLGWDVNWGLNGYAIDRAIHEFLPGAPYKIKQGSLKLSGRTEKEPNQHEAVFAADASVKGLIYQSVKNAASADSTMADYDVHVDAVWNALQGVLAFKKIAVNAPFFAANGKGNLNLNSMEFKDTRLSIENFSLDKLPLYIVQTVEFLPVNMGFTGELHTDLSIDGNVKELHLGIDGDFKNCLLSYGSMFQKQKDLPFRIHTSDLIIRKGTEIKGDFDLELENAKLKGSIVQFNLQSGDLEATIITNQFTVAGWEKYFPPLSDYRLLGLLKVFASAKGNLKDPNMRWMYNLSFDDLGLYLKPNDPVIHHLSGNLDAGPMDFETKDLHFMLGASSVSINAKMFFQDVVRAIVRVEAPSLSIKDVVAALKNSSQIANSPFRTWNWESINRQTNAFSSAVIFENLKAEVHRENQMLDLKQFSASVLDGDLSVSGKIDFGHAKPEYVVDVAANKLRLAKLAGADGTAFPVSGNLFVISHLDGKGWSQDDLHKELNGQMKVTVTNGEFRTFDVLGSLGSVAQLVGLHGDASGTTKFSDTTSSWKIHDGKAETESLLLISDDFDVDASGEIDFLGHLNFRLQTVLSNHLSRKINSDIGPEDRMGPIPLLLTGKIEKPELKPDPSYIHDFLMHVAGKQLSKLIPSKKRESKDPDSLAVDKAVSEPSDTTAETSPSKPSKKELKQAAVQTGMSLLESLFETRE